VKLKQCKVTITVEFEAFGLLVLGVNVLERQLQELIMPGRRNARPIGCFAARVENVVAVASLLKSVAFDEKVNVFVDTVGLKFTVEEGKCVQASVLIPKASFLDFHVAEENVSFKIPFKELLDCLKVFLQ